MQIHIPMGYEIRDGKVYVNKQQSEVIIHIYIEYINGKSLLHIAQNLKAKQIPNTNGNINWTHGAVAKILENKKYIGDDFYPQIIDCKTFETVQNLRNNSKSKPKKVSKDIVVEYPIKPQNMYLSQEVKSLDRLIETTPTKELIYKRAEKIYLESKIYNIERGKTNDF